MNPKRSERIAAVVFWIIGLITLFSLLIIVGRILWKGFLKAVNPSFVFGKPEAMSAGGGVFPMVVSTIYISVLTVIMAFPVAIATAIYLAEYTRSESRIARAIRLSIDALASLPSIVFGLFGMSLFVIFFRWGYSLIAGAATLAVLSLPVIARSAEESIRSVPDPYREASYSLGATKWMTTRQVVLPCAFPGIITGTILAIGRIIGESAAVIYTAGLFVRKIPLNPLRTGAPLSAYIWYAQTEARIPDYRNIVDGGAALLLIVVLLVNFLARRLASYYREKKIAG